MAVTNSFDAERPVTYIVRPELKNEITPSGSFVTTLKASYRWRVEEYQYEQFSDADLSSYFRSGEPERARSQRSPSMTRYKSYSIETRDLVSEEVVSSEELFEYEETLYAYSDSHERVYPYCIPSEDKLLFQRSCRVKTSKDYSKEYFWYVKSNDQWTKIPLDFGVKENVAVLGFEIVREKQSILFLLTSEREKKAYLVSYNYQSFAIEKTIELPSDCSSRYTRMRVLSGARHFSVNYWEKKTSSFKLNIFPQMI